MLEKKEIIAGMLILVLLAVACLLVSLPPHTDPGVEVLEPGVARVHDGETLVLWVPSGKTSVKYHFHFGNDTVSVSGGLFHHDERVILEGCETFRISLFYKVEACRDGQDIIFRWNEFFLGVRIDQ